MATNQQPGSPRRPPGDLHVHGPSYPSAGTVERGTWIVWHNDGPTDLTITFKQGSPDGTPSFTLARERGQHRQEARNVGRFSYEAKPAHAGATGQGGAAGQIAIINVM